MKSFSGASGFREVAFLRSVFASYRARAERGGVAGGRTGAVNGVQPAAADGVRVLKKGVDPSERLQRGFDQCVDCRRIANIGHGDRRIGANGAHFIGDALARAFITGTVENNIEAALGQFLGASPSNIAAGTGDQCGGSTICHGDPLFGREGGGHQRPGVGAAPL